MTVNLPDRAEVPAGSPHPIVLVLDNLRSAYNVGNIFRLAEVARLERIVTVGYTATPPHPKLVKTARGCEELVPFVHADTALAAILDLKAAGYRVIALETAPAAPCLWDLAIPFPVAFVFGNEALGVHPDALAACDQLARLPVFGRKNSLNVSNCAAATVYEALRQYGAR